MAFARQDQYQRFVAPGLSECAKSVVGRCRAVAPGRRDSRRSKATKGDGNKPARLGKEA